MFLRLSKNFTRREVCQGSRDYKYSWKMWKFLFHGNFITSMLLSFLIILSFCFFHFCVFLRTFRRKYLRKRKNKQNKTKKKEKINEIFPRNFQNEILDFKSYKLPCSSTFEYFSFEAPHWKFSKLFENGRWQFYDFQYFYLYFPNRSARHCAHLESFQFPGSPEIPTEFTRLRIELSVISWNNDWIRGKPREHTFVRVPLASSALPSRLSRLTKVHSDIQITFCTKGNFKLFRIVAERGEELVDFCTTCDWFKRRNTWLD